MSVLTTADEIKYSLSEQAFHNIDSLRILKEDLESMIDYETWGGGDWTDSFRGQVENDIEALEKIIRKIKKIKNHYDRNSM